jgi:hypothetical protein
MAEEVIDQDTPLLSPQAFAAKIKAKYPQYKDVDDETLTAKIISKYPTYASQINTGGLKKNASPQGVDNTSQPLNTGGQSDPFSLTSGNNTPVSYAPITDPELRQQQRNHDIELRNQQEQRRQEISNSLKKIRSELPKDAQANWDEAVNLSATRPVDNLREPTQEELAHDKFMQTPLGKTLGTVAYLGSKATKGTLQVAKGTAWLMNKAGLSGAPTQALGDVMSDLAFDKADEASNYGLTKNDQSRFDENKITSNLGGVAEFLPAMAAGGPTFYLQGMGMGKETADQAEKNGAKINPHVKDAFILGTGIANGFLMKALGEGVFSKLPAGLRGDIASKISMDAIKEAGNKELTGEQFQNLINNGVKDWGQKVQQTGLNALKGYNKAVVDLSALSGANFALKKGVDVANDKPVFNESLGDLAENVSNVATEQAPFFAGLGQIGNLGKLTKYSDYKNSATESLMNDPSPENVDRVKQALHDHGFDQNKQDQWTPEEMDATFKQVDNIADVAKKLPRGIPEKKIGDAVDLVQGRDELKKQLADEQGNRQQLDESVNEMPTQHEQLLIDKIDQANDKLRDIVSGKKTTYSIEKGEDGKEDKYFKKVDGKVEPIEKSRYELENLERESKIQPNEQPIESAPTENNIPETPQTNEAGVPEAIGEKPVETTENNIKPIENENNEKSNGQGQESLTEISPESSREENNGVQEGNVSNSGVEQSAPDITNIKENEIRPADVAEQTTGTTEPTKGAGTEVEKAKDESVNTDKTVSKKPRTAEAIKNENTKAKAEEAGIELEDHVGETRSKEVIDKEATKEIKNGYDSHELVRKILEDKHQASDTEVAILAKHTATVKRNYQDLTKKLETDGATMSKREFDDLTAEHEQATKDYQDALNADVKTGTGTARALSARRFAVKNNFSLGQMIKNKRAANNGEKLSTEQVKEVTQRFNEIQEANEKLQARIDKLESENTRIKAEKAIKRIKDGEERIRRKAVTKEELAEDRKKIAADFSAKLKEMRSQGLNDVFKASAEFLQAAAPYVAKMVRNLALEGVTEIKDVVARVKEELDLKDLTDREVTDLIGGVYNEKKGTKSEIEAQIRDLKTQARLIGEIEDAEAGLAKQKTPKPKISEKVKVLRQRLDELQKGTPPTKEETSLKVSKTNAQKKIAELERRIREKDFSKVNPTEIKPDAELIDLRRKADRLMEDYQLQLAKDELANRTKIEKAKDILLDVASLPRALKASLDFSAVLRQGLFATAGHPKEALTAFKEMFRQTVSEEKYKNWISDLKHEPIYDLMQKSDLYLSDKNNAKLLAREEEFTSNLADKIPGIGKLIEASERAYTGYLNVLRAGVFTSEAQKLIQKGYTFENNPEQFKALAKVVNVLTGRGDIPEFLGGKQPKILSSALFSPRFMAARIQTLYLWADPRLPKEAKILAAKDIGTTLASGALILSLAALAGYKVQTDPRSVNFLKIQDKQEHGSTFYDILGGLPQYVRFLAQQGLGEKIPSNGNGVITFGSKKARGTTRLSEASRFLRGKLSPLTGGALNLMEGKDVLGQPYHLWPNVPLEFVPLPYTDVNEAYKIGGIDAAIKAFIPSQFGVGVSSYNPNAKHPKK